MNIRTNYPIQQTQIRQNKINNNSVTAPQAQEYANNSVNFTGLSQLADMFKPAMKRTARMNKDNIYFLEQSATILGVDTEKVMKAAKGKTVGQIRFLSELTDRFNMINFYRPKQERESGEIVLQMFNRVKDPKSEHIRFVNGVNLPIETINKCFERCGDNPKEIKKVEDVYYRLSQTADKENITAQIIESPNMAEYVENLDKYLPYFSIQKETKGLISSIDRQLGTKTIDLHSAANEKGVEEILGAYPQAAAFSKESLLPHYSKDGARVLSDIRIKLAPTKESMENGDVKGLVDIFKSTTPENVEFRRDFLEKNYYNFGKRNDYGENEINELSALFELADKDPATMKFLKGLDVQGILKAGDCFKLLDKVGAEKLAENQKVVKKCILDNRYDATKSVISYFENGGSRMDKFVSSIKSLFGKKPAPVKPVSDMVTISPMSRVMSSYAPKAPKAPYVAPEIKVVPMEEQSILPAAKARKPYVKPEMKAIPMGQVSLLPTGKIEKPVETAAAEVKTAEPVKKVRSYLTFTPVVPKQPNAKKLIVINDVNNVIEKKLGAKTLSEQSGIYADKATKMRLGMLPEIFESIKETRAVERAKGTFSKSKSVSNAEAVDLYTRINGKNKKLVNYMLKKRNADGTRMFSVRDIMETLKDANKEILKGKANSTKANRFTAKDERAIYEGIFEQKVAEHGKLQRTRSTKKS